MSKDNPEAFRSYFKVVYQFDVSSPHLHPLLYIHCIKYVHKLGFVYADSIVIMYSTTGATDTVVYDVE